MRINKFLARESGLSRRSADRAIENGEVRVNGTVVELGSILNEGDNVTFHGQSYPYTLAASSHTLVLLHKPIGYVCSRNGQGSKTVYDLLPEEFQSLKPIGRLDKDSSGLLLLTDDGDLAYQYTHPKFEKEKIYEVELDRQLEPDDRRKIEMGVQLDDGLSHLAFISASGIRHPDSTHQTVRMTEGRNRQIRRTFAALGYAVTHLHRTAFGPYQLGDLSSGKYKRIVL